MAKNTSTPATTKDSGVKYTDPRMAYTGTHSADVKKTSNIYFNEINPDITCNAMMAVAEDQNGLYVTAKNFIDNGLLDGYRLYRRKEYTVTAGENDAFTVTCLATQKSVTL